VSTPHDVVQARPAGYAHAVAAAPGRTVYLAGQTAQDARGEVSGDFVAQFDAAAANVMQALGAAGGAADHLVTMTVFVTDMNAYRTARGALRDVWRARFGTHYPAMAVVGVRELMDPAALVELQAIAVIP
jgi:enamine deaminase RidA (YjgF/YER057c/UK114 family)